MKKRFLKFIFLFLMIFWATFSQSQSERSLRFDQTDWSGGLGPSTQNQYLRSQNLETRDGHLSLASLSNWYMNEGWSYRRRITFNNAGISEELRNFPVVLRLSDINSSLANAGDVRFVSEDGRTDLPYEIEAWNPDTHQGVFWVKIPRISASPETPEAIYIYYGNPRASMGENRRGVWSEGYSSVSHFNFPFRDSTKSDAYNESQVRVRHNLNNDNVIDTSIGKGVRISNDNQALLFNDPSPSGDSSLDYTGGALTLNAVIMNPPDVNGGQILSKVVNGGGIYTYRLLIYPDGSFATNFQGDYGQSQYLRTMARMTPQTYHMATVTVDAENNIKMYIDGILQPERVHMSITNWSAIPDMNQPLCLGTLFPYEESSDLSVSHPDFTFTGVLDEVSVSHQTRSPIWIQTEAKQFLNLDPTNPLSRVGGEETRFAADGFLISNPFCVSEGASWDRVAIHLTQDTSAFSIKVRSAETASMEQAVDFSECHELPASGLVRNDDGSINDCVQQGDHCLQYQITLRSDAVMPVVERLSLSYTPTSPAAPPTETPTSSGRLQPLVPNAGLIFVESGGSTSVKQSTHDDETFDTTQATLSHRPRAVVSVILSVDSPVIRVTPSSLTFTPDNWNVPQSVRIESTRAIRLEESTQAVVHHILVSEDPDYASKVFDLSVGVVSDVMGAIPEVPQTPVVPLSPPNSPAGATPQPIPPVEASTEKTSGCSLILWDDHQ